MNSKYNLILILWLALSLALLTQCGNNPVTTGGTSDQGNAIAMGVVVRDNNQPAPNTQVYLIPINYDPVFDEPIKDTQVDTTNEKGQYLLKQQVPGLYNLFALEMDTRTTHLIKNVLIAEDTTFVPTGSLAQSGSIRVPLFDSTKAENSYLYIQGTMVWASIDSQSIQKGYVILDSVPAGYTPPILYKVNNSPLTIKIVDSSLVLPGRQVDVVVENTLPFTELFGDGNLFSRNWYDDALGIVTSTAESVSGSISSASYQFLPGQILPASGGTSRLRFTESESIYISYYVKYSANWAAIKHREFYLLTSADNDFKGPSYSSLSVYYHIQNGKPGILIQDAQNIDTLQARSDLTQTTENRSVAGCNGDSDGYGEGNCVEGTSPNTWWNQKDWVTDSAYFSGFTGSTYKGDWHHMEFEFKLNSVVAGKGVKDGVLKIWQDSSLILDINNMMFRTAQHSDMKFNQFVINPYLDSASVIDQTYWMDDLEIRTTR